METEALSDWENSADFYRGLPNICPCYEGQDSMATMATTHI
jgi:hypothetical protein